MSRIIVFTGVGAGALFLWWLVAGSTFVGLIDRALTTSIDSASSPRTAVFDGGEEATADPPAFIVGDRSESARSWQVEESPAGRATLVTREGKIVLGAITTREQRRGGRFRYDIAPDSSDAVSLSRRESRISWPRPFEIKLLGGTPARWARHVYRELVWRKANGDVLTVVWRDEKRFTRGSGWVDQYFRSDPVTRLKTHDR